MISLDWIQKMNDFGKKRLPFFFFISYDKSQSYVIPLNELNSKIRFKINSMRHEKGHLTNLNKKLNFEKSPISFENYKQRFDLVAQRLHYGDSFLVNLTVPTPIKTNYSLREIYSIAHAKYKLYIPDQLVIFSPECFVKIINGSIFSYPMKGTIDASLPDAETLLLCDEKEMAEHFTIVDLIRNDLSRVANRVNVTKFRFIDKITSNNKSLLQTSSEIQAALQTDFSQKLGDIFDSLLPAGSITGAPKEKTMEIIKASELDGRGFYTGVFGVFDGNDLDSAVAIRFIEKRGNQMFYRSGGGITAMSKAENEYNELIDKIYVPTDRKHLDQK